MLKNIKTKDIKTTEEIQNNDYQIGNGNIFFSFLGNSNFLFFKKL